MIPFTLIQRIREQYGQTMAEYSVGLAMITVILVATLTLLDKAIVKDIKKVITKAF
jgi:Flp pilus assembly pilin Flp